MRVNVTGDDINAARADLNADPLKLNICHCPVARAIRRAISPEVWVYNDRVEFEINDGDMQCRELPEVARTFIKLFDNGKSVRPISFDISI